MSVSKFESLPNEIISDIFEKYLNGVDILVSFGFQLNRRFDGLVLQSQRFRFNFIKCHLDDFRLCSGLLPAYTNKIEELALSEQNTPGQIHAFLSYFPSFAIFKQLRKLYFHADAKETQAVTIQNALHSLSKMQLHTLCIQLKNTGELYSLNKIIANLFPMTTLKKLSVKCDSYEMDWTLIDNIASNIEYLTIYGMHCNSQNLEYILRCVSGLKYLNIQISSYSSYRYYKQKKASKNETILMPKLQSAIFNMEDNAPEVFGLLESYLFGMSSLRNLEINAKTGIFDGEEWESFLKKSLPKLTHFNLKSCAKYDKQADIDKSIESFQTKFWIEKKNFNVIITKYTSEGDNLLLAYRQYESRNSNHTCWIGPQRQFNGHLSSINNISMLPLSIEASTMLQNHYFHNVNHLVLYNLNVELLEWIKTHMKYSQIKQLDVSCCEKESNMIPLLLSIAQNIIFLRIKSNKLIAHQHEYMGKCTHLKIIDISGTTHSFVEKDMIMIKTLFPNIEHLIINTPDLGNIPMLYTYLPRLHSLSFIDTRSEYFSYGDNYEAKRAEYNLRQSTKFFYQREGNFLTVWTNEDAFQDIYWKLFPSNGNVWMDE